MNTFFRPMVSIDDVSKLTKQLRTEANLQQDRFSRDMLANELREAANMLEKIIHQENSPFEGEKKAADELIQLLMKGESVNPCDWCHAADHPGNDGVCETCCIFEGNDDLQNKFTAFSGLPENVPLTLEQIRKLVGKPVWIKDIPHKEISQWVVISKYDDDTIFTSGGKLSICLLGATWNAYSHEPEEGN